MTSHQTNKDTSFTVFHPCVAMIFFALWICFIMGFFHPIYLIISMISSLVLSLIYFGWRKTLKALTWQLPFLIIITIINPLFSSAGTTPLLRIGDKIIYFEPLLYGLFMGIMLVSMLNVFSCANKAISFEGFTSTMSKKFPSTTLMISIASRLIPSIKKKNATIRDVQKACTCANSNSSSKNVNLRTFTTLMGWCMEDSLTTANSMKISGWSNSRKRSTYCLYRFKRRDFFALTCMFFLAGVCILFIAIEPSNFNFYPTLSNISFSHSFIFFAAFSALPIILEAVRFA